MKLDLGFTFVSTMLGAIALPACRDYLPSVVNSLSKNNLMLLGALVGLTLSLLFLPYSKENKENTENE